MPRARLIGFALLLITFTAVLTTAARAGGGPENLFLVVNSRSWASQTIANHYIRLRSIPSSNVFYLDWDGHAGQATNAALFREKILGPIHAEIRRRGLAQQIDYIVYSTDFPYAVTLGKEFQGQNVGKPFTPVASINGLTYLSTRFLAKDLRYLLFDSNHYMRQAGPDPRSFETHGFRNWYGWAADGRLLDAGGEHYWLSTMLAMASGRGNSVREALSYLNRSARADGTRPRGTIYYAKNNDMRSTAREPAFAGAVAALTQSGVRAEVFNGVLPRGKNDVQGLTTGTVAFDLKQSGSTIRPGAICENLTSFGGQMNYPSEHTPLTDFLRYGAAGASGTVTEPFLIPAKFPFPFIHVHYARGCTLAEAFYQSVHGPYQLLIVGDPLCRPWALIPDVTVDGLRSGQVVAGNVDLNPSADVSVERFELFVDGKRQATCRAGEKLTLNTTRHVDGFHEVRILAIGPGPIESQGRLIVPIRSENFGSKTEVSLAVIGRAGDDGFVTITARADGAERIQLYQASRPLGSIAGESGELRIAKRELGFGPVTIRALAVAGPRASDMVLAEPLKFTVAEPSPKPAVRGPNFNRLTPGVLVRTAAGTAVTVDDASPQDWLKTAGVGADETYQLEAYYSAPQDDLYQVQLRHLGSVVLEVDGDAVYRSDGNGDYKLQFVPLVLAQGLHHFHVQGKVTGRPWFHFRFGGAGTQPMSGKQFRHEPN